MPHIASESFDAVIDKGTLDAILCATSSFDHVPSTLLECARCERRLAGCGVLRAVTVASAQAASWLMLLRLIGLETCHQQ